MPKNKEKRQALGLLQRELAELVGSSEPMLSNFERYKCLPVPAMLKAICKALNCELWELYEYSELFVDTRRLHSELKVGGRQEPCVYKLSVKLPNEAREKLTQANLEKCGYHSLKDFVWRCFKRFEKKLATIQSKEKTTQITTE